jgi:opacity protein-like surface antigen
MLSLPLRGWMVFALVTVWVTHASTANAVLNAGVEAGVVRRTAAEPDNLNVGAAVGAHVELTAESTFAIGAYYLHSSHRVAGRASAAEAHAMFDTFGARGRLILPMPGRTKPYALIGLGHNWVTYSSRETSDVQGGSWELPIGFGVAHQVLKIFQLSLEGAYRPSFSFSGAAYDDARIRQPSGGWSVFAGIALDL